MGVKKSTVCTIAISGLSRYTPASSLVSKPTSTFGSDGRGKRRKTESSNPGLSFAAQPAALTMAVSFTVGVKPHLAIKPFDYSEVQRFVLGSLNGDDYGDAPSDRGFAPKRRTHAMLLSYRWVAEFVG